MAKTTTLLIGTRKGAFILSSDQERAKWKLSEPLFLGHIINDFAADPRSPKHFVIAAKTGHLGPTVFHSSDAGKSWQESKKPPAFARDPEGGSNQGHESARRDSETEAGGNSDKHKKARAVESVFWLVAGHASEPGKWYAGSTPPGLFESGDNGETWQGVSGFNENPRLPEWTSVGPTPGGQIVHSILIHPEDSRHMYLGISVGGTFESKDKGKNWSPLNKGIAADFLPDENTESGHDPHCMVMNPKKPERIYQQNHCGIYRIDRPSDTWERIGKNMPAEIGDIGFPIIVHPRKPDWIWVFPMDGSTVWPRTSPGGKPALYLSRNGGKSWERQDRGLPKRNAYFTVKRQAMCCDTGRSLGLYFGTSQGEIWASSDEGDSFKSICRHLPEVYSVRAVG